MVYHVMMHLATAGNEGIHFSIYEARIEDCRVYSGCIPVEGRAALTSQAMSLGLIVWFFGDFALFSSYTTKIFTLTVHTAITNTSMYRHFCMFTCYDGQAIIHSCIQMNTDYNWWIITNCSQDGSNHILRAGKHGRYSTPGVSLTLTLKFSSSSGKIMMLYNSWL